MLVAGRASLVQSGGRVLSRPPFAALPRENGATRFCLAQRRRGAEKSNELGGRATPPRAAACCRAHESGELGNPYGVRFHFGALPPVAAKGAPQPGATWRQPLTGLALGWLSMASHQLVARGVPGMNDHRKHQPRINGQNEYRQ